MSCRSCRKMKVEDMKSTVGTGGSSWLLYLLSEFWIMSFTWMQHKSVCTNRQKNTVWKAEARGSPSQSPHLGFHPQQTRRGRRSGLQTESQCALKVRRKREREKKYSKYVEGDFGLSGTVCQPCCLSVHAKTWKIGWSVQCPTKSSLGWKRRKHWNLIFKHVTQCRTGNNTRTHTRTHTVNNSLPFGA